MLHYNPNLVCLVNGMHGNFVKKIYCKSGSLYQLFQQFYRLKTICKKELDLLLNQMIKYLNGCTVWFPQKILPFDEAIKITSFNVWFTLFFKTSD